MNQNSNININEANKYKIEIKKDKHSKSNNNMSSSNVPVSLTTEQEIEKYTAKIAKYQDTINKCADADMIEDYNAMINGFENKITALYGEQEKENKKKNNAVEFAERKASFQETPEFAEMIQKQTDEHKKKQNELIVKYKLWGCYTKEYYTKEGSAANDAYVEWSNKVINKELGVGNRGGHNKKDERENTALRNERLPIGVVLVGKVRNENGKVEKGVICTHTDVRIVKVSADTYKWGEQEYNSLNKAWADAYRDAKKLTKGDGKAWKTQGCCWAKLAPLMKNGSVCMKGNAPYYLTHKTYDPLLDDDYDATWFDDKLIEKIKKAPKKKKVKEDTVENV